MESKKKDIEKQESQVIRLGSGKLSAVELIALAGRVKDWEIKDSWYVDADDYGQGDIDTGMGGYHYKGSGNHNVRLFTGKVNCFSFRLSRDACVSLTGGEGKIERMDRDYVGGIRDFLFRLKDYLSVQGAKYRVLANYKTEGERSIRVGTYSCGNDGGKYMENLIDFYNSVEDNLMKSRVAELRKKRRSNTSQKRRSAKARVALKVASSERALNGSEIARRLLKGK